jgi:hypothetical protein
MDNFDIVTIEQLGENIRGLQGKDTKKGIASNILKTVWHVIKLLI